MDAVRVIVMVIMMIRVMVKGLDARTRAHTHAATHALVTLIMLYVVISTHALFGCIHGVLSLRFRLVLEVKLSTSESAMVVHRWNCSFHCFTYVRRGEG